MKEIVKVLLQEGISEEVIHEVLDVISEVSRSFKSTKIKNATQKVADYGNDIDKLEVEHPELPRHVIDLLRDDQIGMTHRMNVRAHKNSDKEQDLIKQEEKAEKQKKAQQ